MAQTDWMPGALEQAFGARPDRLAGFDPRARIIIAALFAVTVVSLQSLSMAVLVFSSAGLIAWLGGVSARRLRYLLPLELLMLVLLMTLPFSVPGAPVLQLGPLAASADGLSLALLILLKANAVVLSLFGLVGALGPAATVHALARLGLPSKLCHLLLLTLRQIELVGDEYRRMRLAMRARAFVPRSDRHSWRALGWLIGMLLVRSLARAQRVADAMRCRGFDGRLRLLQRFSWQRGDTLVILGVTMLLLALVLADHRGWPSNEATVVKSHRVMLVSSPAFRAASSVAEPATLPTTLLEGKQKSGAIRDELFWQSPGRSIVGVSEDLLSVDQQPSVGDSDCPG